MLLSLRKNGLDSRFKEVRVLKASETLKQLKNDYVKNRIDGRFGQLFDTFG